MGKYTSTWEATAGTNLTMLGMQSTASVRSKMNHIILGSSATPANNAGEFIVARVTAIGSGGQDAPEIQIDPDSAAASVTCLGGAFTIEPSYSDEFLEIAVNQQATFQWWANPGFELVANTGIANGTFCRSVSQGGSATYNTTMMWEE